MMEQSRAERQRLLRLRRRRIKIWSAFGAALLLGAIAIGASRWMGHSEGTDPAGTPAVQTQASISPAAVSPVVKNEGSSPSVAGSPVSPAPSQAAGTPVDPSAQVSMAFVGDVIFASTVETTLQKNGYDYPYRELQKELSSPDLTVANLESPVTNRGDEQKKQYVYRSKPEALKAFHQAGFDIVNLANNHIMDYGVEGLLDTMGYLDKEGILRTGAGADTDEAYKPVIVEKNGIKLAFLGFSHKVPDDTWKAGAKKPGTAELYAPQKAFAAISAAKEKADLVIVMAHWGEEREDQPQEKHRVMAHTFIDQGADLVIGTHPHVLQSLELYKGKYIAYSLGNFLFTTNTYKTTWDTIVLNADCDKAGACRLNAVPVTNTSAHPVRMEETAGKQLFARLTKLSYGVSVDEQGRIGPAAAGR